uniref:Acid sensing ion channel subunit 3 n=1 Tax=Anolis carolinensis TaxID=28377 RepID=A0A803SS09_ANOCA
MAHGFNFLIKVKEEEEEEKSSCRIFLAAFAGGCTLHGLSHVFLPGPLTPRRLAWAGAVLAALGAFLFQAAERVRYFRGYPRVTTLDEAEGRALLFPAVSLCNFNRARRSRLTPDDLRWVGPPLLGVEPPDFPRYLQALGWEGPPALGPFFPSTRFDMQAFVGRTGHRMEDMLLGCRFGGRECGPANFTSVSPPQHTPRLSSAETPSPGMFGHTVQVSRTWLMALWSAVRPIALDQGHSAPEGLSCSVF